MLSDAIQLLFDRLQKLPPVKEWSDIEGPRFSTNAIASKAGSLYEKLRYLVEYKEEHAIRRAAIERIIRRQVVYEERKKIGELLLEELVRAQYIQNNTLPEAFATEVQSIINKYAALEKFEKNLEKVIWSFAAIEIEQLLFPSRIDEPLVESFFNTVVEYVQPKNQEAISPKNFSLQLYIACRRVLLRDTYDELVYALYIGKTPSWKSVTVENQEEFATLALSFRASIADAAKLVSSSVNWKISSRLRNHGISFLLIRDIVRQEGMEAEHILSNNELLATKARELLTQIYHEH